MHLDHRWITQLEPDLPSEPRFKLVKQHDNTTLTRNPLTLSRCRNRPPNTKIEQIKTQIRPKKTPIGNNPIETNEIAQITWANLCKAGSEKIERRRNQYLNMQGYPISIYISKGGLSRSSDLCGRRRRSFLTLSIWGKTRREARAWRWTGSGVQISDDSRRPQVLTCGKSKRTDPAAVPTIRRFSCCVKSRNRARMIIGRSLYRL